jgi:hypothetical protein
MNFGPARISAEMIDSRSSRSLKGSHEKTFDSDSSRSNSDLLLSRADRMQNVNGVLCDVASHYRVLRKVPHGATHPRPTRADSMVRAIHVACAVNRFLSGHASSPSPTLDAMLSDWPYRNALPMSHAYAEIRRCAGTKFDPKIVEVFLTIPENRWIELRENLGSPFRLTHPR